MGCSSKSSVWYSALNWYVFFVGITPCDGIERQIVLHRSQTFDDNEDKCTLFRWYVVLHRTQHGSQSGRQIPLIQRYSALHKTQTYNHHCGRYTVLERILFCIELKHGLDIAFDKLEVFGFLQVSNGLPRTSLLALVLEMSNLHRSQHRAQTAKAAQSGFTWDQNILFLLIIPYSNEKANNCSIFAARTYAVFALAKGK